MVDDNNYTSPSRSSPCNYGDESGAEQLKTSVDADNIEDVAHIENADEDDEQTLKERISKK